MATLRTRLAARRNDDGERGAAAVEFALVLPILILLVFGIIEFGMTFKDTLSIASATRAGARTASSLPRSPSFNDATANAVARAMSAVPAAAVEEMWVYQADTSGYPIGRTDFSSGCTSCTRWRWNVTTRQFENPIQTWDYSTQDACANSAMSVGVYLKINHDFITGLFGEDMTLTDHTVMRFEPRPLFQVCR